MEYRRACGLGRATGGSRGRPFGACSLVAGRHLAMCGVSRERLQPARWLPIRSSLVTLALNVADPLVAGQFGKAAFDAVGPLLLIGWGEVGRSCCGLWTERSASEFDAVAETLASDDVVYGARPQRQAQHVAEAEHEGQPHDHTDDHRDRPYHPPITRITDHPTRSPHGGHRKPRSGATTSNRPSTTGLPARNRWSGASGHVSSRARDSTLRTPTTRLRLRSSDMVNFPSGARSPGPARPSRRHRSGGACSRISIRAAASGAGDCS